MTIDEKKLAKALYDKQYREKNKEKIRLYKKNYNNGRVPIVDKIKKSHWDKIYSIKNKDKVNIIKKNWAKANPEKVKLAKKKV